MPPKVQPTNPAQQLQEIYELLRTEYVRRHLSIKDGNVSKDAALSEQLANIASEQSADGQDYSCVQVIRLSPIALSSNLDALRAIIEHKKTVHTLILANANGTEESCNFGDLCKVLKWLHSNQSIKEFDFSGVETEPFEEAQVTGWLKSLLYKGTNQGTTQPVNTTLTKVCTPFITNQVETYFLPPNRNRSQQLTRTLNDMVPGTPSYEDLKKQALALLAQGVSVHTTFVDEKDKSTYDPRLKTKTPLHKAIELRDLNFVKELLNPNGSFYANVMMQDGRNRHALQLLADVARSSEQTALANEIVTWLNNIPPVQQQPQEQEPAPQQDNAATPPAAGGGPPAPANAPPLTVTLLQPASTPIPPGGQPPAYLDQTSTGANTIPPGPST